MELLESRMPDASMIAWGWVRKAKMGNVGNNVMRVILALFERASNQPTDRGKRAALEMADELEKQAAERRQRILQGQIEAE